MGMDQQNVFHHQLSQVYIIINGLFRVNLLLNQEQQQIASATAKHSYDNTAYETKKLTVRLTCSSTGVLS